VFFGNGSIGAAIFFTVFMSLKRKKKKEKEKKRSV